MKKLTQNNTIQLIFVEPACSQIDFVATVGLDYSDDDKGDAAVTTIFGHIS